MFNPIDAIGLQLTGKPAGVEEAPRTMIVMLNAIDAIEQRDGFTEVRTRGHHFLHVTETLDEVTEKILTAMREMAAL